MNCIYIFKGQKYTSLEALQDAMAETYKDEGGYLGTLSQYYLTYKQIQELKSKGVTVQMAEPASPSLQDQIDDINKRRQEELDRRVNNRKGPLEVQKAFEDNLKEGQEIPEYSKLGAKYVEGLNVTATFVDRRSPETKGDGYSIVTKIIKPAIEENGRLIQAAVYEVSIFDSKEDAEEWFNTVGERTAESLAKIEKRINEQYDAEIAALKGNTTQKKKNPVNINARFPKDQTKADYADGIIAYGTHSTGKYAKAFGGTRESFKPGEVIMISVNGNNRPNQKENVEKTKKAIDKALAQGVSAFIADNKTTANSKHNSGGEGVIRDYLLSKGLQYTEFNGVGVYTVVALSKESSKKTGTRRIGRVAETNQGTSIEISAFNKKGDEFLIVYDRNKGFGVFSVPTKSGGFAAANLSKDKTKEVVDKYIPKELQDLLTKWGSLQQKPGWAAENSEFDKFDKEVFQPKLKELNDKYDAEINKNAENISSKGSSFAKKLTNLGNNLSVTYKGKVFRNAEHAYQTYKSGEFDQVAYNSKQAKPKGSKKANFNKNFDIMVEILTAKLQQHPELMQGIAERGGLSYIEQSTHDVYGKDKYWETSSGQNKFIEALAQAYKNVGTSNSQQSSTNDTAKQASKQAVEENNDILDIDNDVSSNVISNMLNKLSKFPNYKQGVFTALHEAFAVANPSKVKDKKEFVKYVNALSDQDIRDIFIDRAASIAYKISQDPSVSMQVINTISNSSLTLQGSVEFVKYDSWIQDLYLTLAAIDLSENDAADFAAEASELNTRQEIEDLVILYAQKKMLDNLNKIDIEQDLEDEKHRKAKEKEINELAEKAKKDIKEKLQNNKLAQSFMDMFKAPETLSLLNSVNHDRFSKIFKTKFASTYNKIVKKFNISGASKFVEFIKDIHSKSVKAAERILGNGLLRKLAIATVITLTMSSTVGNVYNRSITASQAKIENVYNQLGKVKAKLYDTSVVSLEEKDLLVNYRADLDNTASATMAIKDLASGKIKEGDPVFEAASKLLDATGSVIYYRTTDISVVEETEYSPKMVEPGVSLGSYGDQENIIGCARHVNRTVMASGFNHVELGVIGDAWNMLFNIQRANGQVMYDLRDTPGAAYEDIRAGSHISDINRIRKNQRHRDPYFKTAPKEGDVVGILYKGSPNQTRAYYGHPDAKQYNSHVGIIKYVNGVPYLSDWTGKRTGERLTPWHKIINNQDAKMRVAWVARPNYETTKKASFFDRAGVGEENLAHTWDKSMAFNGVASQIVSVLHKNLDTLDDQKQKDFIMSSVYVIMGQESAFGQNIVSKTLGVDMETPSISALKNIVGLATGERASEGYLQAQMRLFKKLGIKATRAQLFDRVESTKLGIQIVQKYDEMLKNSPNAEQYEKLGFSDKVALMAYVHNRGIERYVEEGGLDNIIQRMVNGPLYNQAVYRANYLNLETVNKSKEYKSIAQAKKLIVESEEDLAQLSNVSMSLGDPDNEAQIDEAEKIEEAAEALQEAVKNSSVRAKITAEQRELMELEEKLKELEEAVKAEADDEAAKEASKYVSEDGKKFYELAPSEVKEDESTDLSFLETAVLDPNTFQLPESVEEFLESVEDEDLQEKARSKVIRVLNQNATNQDSKETIDELYDLLGLAKPDTSKPKPRTTKQLQTRLRHRVWDPEKGYFYSEAIGTKSQAMSGRDHFGVRIPTQDKHSMAVIRFVDYLSDYNTNTLVLPYELVLLTGMDFDIDSFYVHSPKGTAGDYLSSSKERLSKTIEKELSKQAQKTAQKEVSKSQELAEMTQELSTQTAAIAESYVLDNPSQVVKYIKEVLSNLDFLEDDDLVKLFIKNGIDIDDRLAIIDDNFLLEDLISIAKEYKKVRNYRRNTVKERKKELLESEEYAEKRSQMTKNWEIFQDLDNASLEDYRPQSMDEANNILLELQKRLINSSREIMGSPATMDDPNKLTDEVTEKFEEGDVSNGELQTLPLTLSNVVIAEEGTTETADKFKQLINYNNELTKDQLLDLFGKDSIQYKLLSMLDSDYTIQIDDSIVQNINGKKISIPALVNNETQKMHVSRAHLEGITNSSTRFKAFGTLLAHELAHVFTVKEIENNKEYREELQQLAYDVVQDILQNGDVNALGVNKATGTPYLLYALMGTRAMTVTDGDYASIPASEYDVKEMISHLLSSSKFASYAKNKKEVKSSAFRKLFDRFIAILNEVFNKNIRIKPEDKPIFKNLYDQLLAANVVAFKSQENIQEDLFKLSSNVYIESETSTGVFSRDPSYLDEIDYRKKQEADGKWKSGEGGLGEARAGNTNNAFDMSSKARAQESIDIGGQNIGLPARANIMQQRFATSKMNTAIPVFGKSRFSFKDHKGERVVDKISQALSMMVDNATEQLAKQLNLSLETLAPVLSMIGLGVPSTTAYHVSRSRVVANLGKSLKSTLVSTGLTVADLPEELENYVPSDLSLVDDVYKVIDMMGFEAYDALLLAAQAYNNPNYNKKYVYEADQILTAALDRPVLFTKEMAEAVEYHAGKQFVNAAFIAQNTRHINKVLDLFKQLKPSIDQLKELPSTLERMGITYEYNTMPGEKPKPSDIVLKVITEKTELVDPKSLAIPASEMLRMIEDHPDIKLFIQNAIAATKIYGNFFLSHTDVVNNIVDKAANNFKSGSHKYVTRARQHMLNFISSSIYVKDYADSRGMSVNDVKSKMTDILFEDDLSNRIVQAVAGTLNTNMDDKYIKALKSNEFLKYLGTDTISYTSAGPMNGLELHTIFTNTWTQKNFDMIESFINGWESLQELGNQLEYETGDQTITNLVDDLFLYLVAKDALGFTSGSFIRSISPKAFLPVSDRLKRVHEIFKDLDYEDMSSVPDILNEEFKELTGLSLKREEDTPWIEDFIVLFLSQERNSDVVRIGSMNQLRKVSNGSNKGQKTLLGGPNVKNFNNKELDTQLNKVFHMSSDGKKMRVNFRAGISAKPGDSDATNSIKADRTKALLDIRSTFGYKIIKGESPEIVSTILNKGDSGAVREVYIKDEIEYSFAHTLQSEDKYPDNIQIQYKNESGVNQQGTLTHRYKYSKSTNKAYVQLKVKNPKEKYLDYIWVDMDSINNKDRLSFMARSVEALATTKQKPSAVTYSLASPFGSSNLLTYAYGLDGSLALFADNYANQKSKEYEEYLKLKGKNKKKKNLRDYNFSESSRRGPTTRLTGLTEAPASTVEPATNPAEDQENGQTRVENTQPTVKKESTPPPVETSTEEVNNTVVENLFKLMNGVATKNQIIQGLEGILEDDKVSIFSAESTSKLAINRLKLGSKKLEHYIANPNELKPDDYFSIYIVLDEGESGPLFIQIDKLYGEKMIQASVKAPKIKFEDSSPLTIDPEGMNPAEIKAANGKASALMSLIKETTVENKKQAYVVVLGETSENILDQFGQPEIQC